MIFKHKHKWKREPDRPARGLFGMPVVVRIEQCRCGEWRHV